MPGKFLRSWLVIAFLNASQGRSPVRNERWARALLYTLFLSACTLNSIESQGQTRLEAKTGAANTRQVQNQPPNHQSYSIAWHYGAKPPLDSLRIFDRVVVEPDHGMDPKAYQVKTKGKSELYAYLAIGEVQKSRGYFKAMPESMLRGENKDWASLVIDQSHEQWPNFFVEKIVAPQWERGYRGFFLDTMDSYQLIAKDDTARKAQVQGMIKAIRKLKEKYPQAKLVFNRGFELLPELGSLVEAVAAESLFQAWDNAAKAYKEVPPEDRKWLMDRLKEAQALGLEAISIDYVDPKNAALARDTVAKISNLGLTPYVSDGLLLTTGRGKWEITPRKVLLLHDTKINKDVHFAGAQRFLVTPLQYLGYRVDLVDIRDEPVPEGFLGDQYAAVIVQVTSSDSLAKFKLEPFIAQAHEHGLKLIFFDGLGEILDGKLASRLGLSPVTTKLHGPFKVENNSHGLTPYEVEVSPKIPGSRPFKLNGPGQSLLSIIDSKSQRFDAVGVTPWGGWAMMSQVFTVLKNGEFTRWAIDPIAFLEKALDAPKFPVPDVTTEAGRRLLLVHIDGDGFASRAEIPKLPFAAEVMHRDFIARYKVPHTVSIIQGEIASNGLYPQFTPTLEKIARDIFALDNVEIASHSFSHPFYWYRAVDEGDNPKLRLPIPNYKVDLENEIAGSARYINEKLAPPGKRTKVFLWTGDCVPTAEALAITYRHQLFNMNGGDTTISKAQPSLTMVAPQSIRKNGSLQIYAPMQNENVYTNDWTGPFYGFTRLIETLELTDKPRRLKPINIYYHTYSASKPASIEALHKVYQYALAQPHTAIFGSEYIQKVLDWEDLVIARDLSQADPLAASQNWLLVGDGSVRSFRLPKTTKLDMTQSENLAGSSVLHDGLYLHTSDARSVIRGAKPLQVASLSNEFAASRSLSPTTLPASRSSLSELSYAAGNTALIVSEILEAFANESVPQIHDANGTISEFQRNVRGFSFSLLSHSSPEFRLRHAANCQVTSQGQTLQPSSVAWSTLQSPSAHLSPSLHDYRLPETQQKSLVQVRC
jgi:polysaccharide biosynthesis protein PelA